MTLPTKKRINITLAIFSLFLFAANTYAKQGMKPHFNRITPCCESDTDNTTADDKNNHILGVAVDLINAAKEGSQIRMSTCIWRDDAGQKILDALADAKNNRNADVKAIYTYKSGFQSSSDNTTIQSELGNAADSAITNPSVKNVKSSSASKNGIDHAKFICIDKVDGTKLAASITQFDNDSKSPDDLYNVTLITSGNWCYNGTQKYQDSMIFYTTTESDDTGKGVPELYTELNKWFDKIWEAGCTGIEPKSVNSIQLGSDKTMFLDLFPKKNSIYTESGAKKPTYKEWENTDAINQLLSGVVASMNNTETVPNLYMCGAYWNPFESPLNYGSWKYYNFRQALMEQIKTINEKGANSEAGGNIHIVFNQIIPNKGNEKTKHISPNNGEAYYPLAGNVIADFWEMKNKNNKFVCKSLFNGGPQITPYVHAKTILIDGAIDGKTGSKFIYTGSANKNIAGNWQQYDVMVLVSNSTEGFGETWSLYTDWHDELVNLGKSISKDSLLWNNSNTFGFQPTDGYVNFYKTDDSGDELDGQAMLEWKVEAEN